MIVVDTRYRSASEPSFTGPRSIGQLSAANAGSNGAPPRSVSSSSGCLKDGAAATLAGPGPGVGRGLGASATARTAAASAAGAATRVRVMAATVGAGANGCARISNIGR